MKQLKIECVSDTMNITKLFNKDAKGEREALKFLEGLSKDREHPTQKLSVFRNSGGVYKRKNIKGPKSNLSQLTVNITTVENIIH